MTDSQTLVRRSTDVGAISELEDALTTGKPIAEVASDPEDISREIIRQLLEATDDEQLERLEAESWREKIGVPYEIHDFIWRPSTFDEGHVVFLVVRAIDMRDGTPHVLTTGAGQVMAQLANLAKRDRLPCVRQLAGDETKQGNKVYWLESPPEIAQARRDEVAKARDASDPAA